MRILPGDVVIKIADLCTPRETLHLFVAVGLNGRGGAALRRAFADAGTLKRVARQRHDSDAAVFARWDRLPASLQGVIAELPAHLLRRVFRGAASAGVAALSRVDCARPRVDRPRRDVDARALERKFQRETAAIPAELRALMAQGGVDSDSMRVDHTSTDSLFSEALVSLAGDWRAQRAVGVDSSEWAWIARHASVKNPSLSGNVMSSLLQRASDGLLQEVFHHHGPPRLGKLDVAAVYARDRVVALERCAKRGSHVCDGCFATAHLCCTICSYALCADCARAAAPGAAPGVAPTHVCEPRLLGICSAFSSNASAFVDYMHDFSGAYRANNAVIATPERLAANLALFEKIEAQRRWILDAASDRDVARAKIASSPAAHQAWLDEVYAVDKFA